MNGRLWVMYVQMDGQTYRGMDRETCQLRHHFRLIKEYGKVFIYLAFADHQDFLKQYFWQVEEWKLHGTKPSLFFGYVSTMPILI